MLPLLITLSYIADMDDFDDLEGGICGRSTRIPRMRSLLVTYPNDKILQHILAPVFLYHYKL